MKLYNIAQRSAILSKKAYQDLSEFGNEQFTVLDFIEVSSTDSVCLIAEWENVIYIAFRGTDSTFDVLLDIFCSAVHFHNDLPQESLVAAGFKISFDSIIGQIFESIKSHASSNSHIVFTGHSLGGALATMCISYFQLEKEAGNLSSGLSFELVSFGSPAVGTRAFVAWYNKKFNGNSRRYITSNDPVPKTAKIGHEFIHVNEEIELEGSLDLSTIKSHGMARYRELVNMILVTESMLSF